MAGFQVDITGAVKLALQPVFTLVRRIRDLIQLRQRVSTLTKEMSELRDIRADTQNDVLSQETTTTRRTNQVSSWMQNVDSLNDEVVELHKSFKDKNTNGLRWCPCRSSDYQLSRGVADKLEQVRRLKCQRGKFDNLVSHVLPDAVEAVPNSSTSIVGGEATLSTIRGYLRDHDDSVGIIGIYGMGGVGKTTLMKKINNEFLETGNNDFDVVVWINVSQDPDIFKIQEDIGVRLGFSRRGEEGRRGRSLPTNETDRVSTLYHALRSKKFLLLLDDLWKGLDLEKIGIPRPNNKNKGKIMFTTRSREVCADMDAQKKVEVKCLSKGDSWKLFCEKVGAEVVDLENNPSIRPFAETVAGKCGGLPLALITVGRAMADATTIGEWKEAAARLRESPHKVRGMEEKVLSILKFSFDRLNDESAKQCLLYCCLFPEDHDIDIEQLIDYWVGEGFLDADPHSDSIVRARDSGRVIITKLKAACLLENSYSVWKEDRYVKMHDVVREMTLWLVTAASGGVEVDGGGGGERNKFLVDAGAGLQERVPKFRGWGDAKRISLMHNDIEELPDVVIPTCPKLLTLLTSHNPFDVVPRTFFHFTPVLRVLDLSDTNIKELPKDVGLLVELRYLNLQRTWIRSLPKELGKLVKLRQLDLSHTYGLSQIPREAIAKLTRLKTLNLFCSGYSFKVEAEEDEETLLNQQVTLMDLERCSLEELGLDIKYTSSSSLERLVSSYRLSRCTRFLTLWMVSGLTPLHLSVAFEKLENLRELRIHTCPELEELRFESGGRQLGKLEELHLAGLDRARIEPVERSRSGGGGLLPPLLQSLRRLEIQSCHGFEDLTWVRQLPCLEEIDLSHCDGITELLLLDGSTGGGGGDVKSDDDGGDSSLFLKLKFLSLYKLPALKSLSRRPLLFPSLEELRVMKCPELKKLPLGPHSGKNIREIKCEQEWWDRLEWDGIDDGRDRNVKSTFLPYFKPSSSVL